MADNSKKQPQQKISKETRKTKSSEDNKTTFSGKYSYADAVKNRVETLTKSEERVQESFKDRAEQECRPQIAKERSLEADRPLREDPDSSIEPGSAIKNLKINKDVDERTPVKNIMKPQDCSFINIFPNPVLLNPKSKKGKLIDFVWIVKNTIKELCQSSKSNKDILNKLQRIINSKVEWLGKYLSSDYIKTFNPKKTIVNTFAPRSRNPLSVQKVAEKYNISPQFKAARTRTSRMLNFNINESEIKLQQKYSQECENVYVTNIDPHTNMLCAGVQASENLSKENSYAEEEYDEQLTSVLNQLIMVYKNRIEETSEHPKLPKRKPVSFHRGISGIGDGCAKDLKFGFPPKPVSFHPGIRGIGDLSSRDVDFGLGANLDRLDCDIVKEGDTELSEDSSDIKIEVVADERETVSTENASLVQAPIASHGSGFELASSPVSMSGNREDDLCIESQYYKNPLTRRISVPTDLESYGNSLDHPAKILFQQRFIFEQEVKRISLSPQNSLSKIDTSNLPDNLKER